MGIGWQADVDYYYKEDFSFSLTVILISVLVVGQVYYIFGILEDFKRYFLPRRPFGNCKSFCFLLPMQCVGSLHSAASHCLH